MNETQRILQGFQEHMVPNYAPFEVVPYRAEGSRIWDLQERSYIDFAGGIAVMALGHNHPEIVKALQKQSNKLWHVSNYYTNLPAVELAQRLCELTFGDRVFFANSGSEANEAALKLARRYAFEKHGVEKNEILSFHLSFHGRSLFTVSAGGQAKYRQGFGPLPPKILHLPHNDLDSLEKTLTKKCCAVIMEPIMAESGIIEIEATFAKKVRELCTEMGALLIFDEVQTGMGRTGSLFAYQEMGVEPDILTSAKALGCGFPISAMITTEEIARSFTVGSHGSTFGGNPLAAVVAKRALDLIADPELLEGVRRKRKRFTQRLQAISDKTGLFEEIRGKGLLIGCALAEPFKGRAVEFVKAGLAEGVMLLLAGPDVLRFAPSLIIEDDLIDEGLDLLEKAIEKTI